MYKLFLVTGYEKILKISTSAQKYQANIKSQRGSKFSTNRVILWGFRNYSSLFSLFEWGCNGQVLRNVRGASQGREAGAGGSGDFLFGEWRAVMVEVMGW